MTIIQSTDFYGDAEVKPEVMSTRWFKRLGFYSLAGLILIIMNFPKFLTRLIDANVANTTWHEALTAPIKAMQVVLNVLIGSHPTDFFVRAMTCSFALLWLFLSLLAIFSVRRRGLRMFAYGLGGIIIGYLALHLIAWAAVALVVTIKGTIYVVAWAASGISTLVAFIFRYTWPIFLFVLMIIALYTAYSRREGLIKFLRWLGLKLRRYRTHILGTVIVLWLLTIAVPIFYKWVMLPVWHFIKLVVLPPILFVIKWIIVIPVVALFVVLFMVLGVVSLALVGSLLISQLQAGWHAARSLRHVLVAGFAIGSALALIVLVSMATPALAEAINQAWINALAIMGLADSHTTTHFVTVTFQTFLPRIVEVFAYTHLTNLQAPALDSLIFLVVMTLGSLSLLFRVFSTHPIKDEYIPVQLVAWEYIKMAGGLFVALLLIFAAAESGDSQA